MVSDVLEAMEKPKIPFPYEDDDGDEHLNESCKRTKVGDRSYKFNMNRKFTDQEKIGDELMQRVMTGTVVEITAHKTADQGAVLLWLSTIDMILLQCYIEIASTLAQSRGINYNLKGSLFVNWNFTPFLGDNKSMKSKRQIDFRRWCRIAEVPTWRSNLSRHMFCTTMGSIDSILMREYAAKAAKHSVQTQQNNYVSGERKAFEAIKARFEARF